MLFRVAVVVAAASAGVSWQAAGTEFALLAGGSVPTGGVVAGVVLAGQADPFTNARIRIQLHAVNGAVVFLLESVVFSLIGLTLPGQVAALTEADRLCPCTPSSSPRP
ncbi:hypothetical protein Sxan_33350 [Streptomyces xanthophaeus]|uniref:Cation/H+ exchanger domain-containing protein n=1 Tax=Streptomyces xanthophaeus TaxID=67385 RepID=A0A919LD28_9ACTN|nr:hypothetical protein Sxan_33350 [Streptomyces xanthophaeus]